MKPTIVPARHAACILAALMLTSCHESSTAPLPPVQLAFLVSPSMTSEGMTITPAVRVAIQDANGQTVTSATNPVTVSLGVNPAGATLSGTTTVNAVNGVATFSDLSIDKPTADYTQDALTATSPDLTYGISAYFTIAGPSKLIFTTGPRVTPAGVTMTPAVQVAIEDALGNIVSSASDAVTVTLTNNAAGATLSGTTTVHAVKGVATFSDLAVDKPGDGYTLAAASGPLIGITSVAFTISPPPTALHVVTTTTGASLPGSYRLSIDCGSYGYEGCAYNSTIGVNDDVTVSAASGVHYVELDVADNCAVTGAFARTITAVGITDVPFTVTCTGVGTVQVSTTTSGTDLTPDGYSVCIDQSVTACFWHAQARANDVISIGRVIAGPHTVVLTGVGGNCAVGGGAAHTVTVSADVTVSAPFAISCTPTERVAFSSGGSISMVHTDGTAAHVIVGGLAPAWSPDGGTLAYECGPNICAISVDGTNSRQMTNGPLGGAGNHHPTWSPDGFQLAFASNAGGSTDLYVVPAGGGDAVRLTNGVGFRGNPAWSPDGTQIAFDCELDAGNTDICVVKADGTAFARLTNDPARDHGAAWKPDGSMLAFSTTRFGVDEIVLMGRPGGSVTRIGGGLPGLMPTWSPDGTQLGFVQLLYDPSSGPPEAVVVARTDGSNLHVVVRGTQPAWRPHR